MSELKTIKVFSKDAEYHGGEPFTINETDFDPEQHELAEPKPEAKGEPKGKGKSKGGEPKEQ